MSNDIVLTGQQRDSVLTLRSIDRFLTRTQRRLSTGKEINSVIDGPVEFFQTRALTRRADLLLERRDTVEQSISTLQAQLDGLQSIDELLDQLRGLVIGARSESQSRREESTKSFRTTGEQIQKLLNDISYQGVNLLRNPNAELQTRFSDRIGRDETGVDFASELVVNGIDLRSVGFRNTAVTGRPLLGGLFDNDFFETENLNVRLTGFGRLNDLAGDNTFGSIPEAATLTSAVEGAAIFGNAFGTAATLDITGITNINEILFDGDTFRGYNAADGADSAGAAFAQQVIKGIVRSLGAPGGTGFTTATLPGGAFTFTYTLDFGADLLGSDGVTPIANSQVLEFEATIRLTAEQRNANIRINNAAGLLDTTADARGLRQSGLLQNVIEQTLANGRVTSRTLARVPVENELLHGATLAQALNISAAFVGFTQIGSDQANLHLTDGLVAQIEEAQRRVETLSANFGNAVQILQTRSDFSERYASTLSIGADKIQLADNAQEGAYLTALRTRNQIAIEQLSIASQNLQAILTLFR